MITHGKGERKFVKVDSAWSDLLQREGEFAYLQDSILKQTGIDFMQFNERGVNAMWFGKLLTSSGIVLNDSIH
ncbi:hypothetical protein MLD38_005319 [Melastoma candidum]|uniref:Uncharacterized protein n=1 Tax=Melastoma candidum TaxID=119954 RepID=A0ACB9SAE3_9MYRT|nr:hypothetical protein MLD38_005319 [Melastoma candidum]